jgi:FkbM family methyltransferase
MSLQTMPATLALRRFARALGLTPILGRYLNRRGYELAFDDALAAAMRPGDTVWDVGANVGYYSRRFAEAVRPGGQVFAFEPSPVTLPRLRAEVGSEQDVTIVPVGLGAEAATMSFVQSDDDLGVASKVVAPGTAEGAHEVEIETGDRLVRDGRVVPPNVIKIDVEGFELDVLKGMTATLRDPRLRSVCVEVHFTQLAERGLPTAPRTIERLLREAGFTLRWTDPSHLVGSRT